MKIDRLQMRLGLELHQTVIQPDIYSMDWNPRLVVIPVIPNLVRKALGTLHLPQ